MPARRGATKRLSRLAAAGVLCTALAGPCAAHEVDSGAGFFVDLPAGFAAGESDGLTGFSYVDPQQRMEFAVRVYAPGRFASAEAMAAEILGRLGSSGQRTAFLYEGRPAVIAEVSFAPAAATRRGYAVFIAGQAERAHALLAHVDASRFDVYADLIISCLDGFSVDRAARRAPGPISQFLLPWPPERPRRRLVRLPAAGAVELPWSPEELRHELYVAEREHRILTRYAQSRTLWVDAWARFYRMVYRESAARLDSIAEAFARPLRLDDPTELTRQALLWVQGFTFRRDVAGLDFSPPLAAAYEQVADCDARAMVMGILLERLGIDCVLMLSREYSHAMLGVDVPGGGQRFAFGGRAYLVAETTAGVGLGMIDASQADFSKWLGVDLGERR
jgi:hypothetical protein